MSSPVLSHVVDDLANRLTANQLLIALSAAGCHLPSRARYNKRKAITLGIEDGYLGVIQQAALAADTENVAAGRRVRRRTQSALVTTSVGPSSSGASTPSTSSTTIPPSVSLPSPPNSPLSLPSSSSTLLPDTPHPVPVSSSSPSSTSHDAPGFLSLPTTSELHSIYRSFYNATSATALKLHICAVCGRERLNSDVQADEWGIADIPNRERLHPSDDWIGDAASLVDGLLLIRKACSLVEGEPHSTGHATICVECITDLCKVYPSTDYPPPPKYSLANGLWYGDRPWELEVLTLPERLLISRIYPRVYIVKLFPRSGRFNPESLQNALVGNVTSFDLSSERIADMVEGRLMPQPPSVLASLISLTFVGVKAPPKESLRTTFQVRRDVVRRALAWLKQNNRYYSNIDITEERLQDLPEADVPPEIWGLAREDADPTALQYERATYVPADDDSENQASFSGDGPDVIPLQAHGVIDTDLTDISASSMTTQGLANLWDQGKEGLYAVLHGQQPASDFPPRGEAADSNGHENFWEKCFSSLFPYGCGGLERLRPIRLSLQDHVSWLLEQHDHRFRKDLQFPFTALAIIQRREALLSARVQMSRRNFESEAALFRTISADDWKNAVKEEERGDPISNATVRYLKERSFATTRPVTGSNAGRSAMRSEINATCTQFGLPSLWITINPDDINDPIVQLFMNENINMDDFIREAGPDKATRAKNVASDPYAAAKFFNFLIKLVLEILIGVKATPRRVETFRGIFGEVQAYFGSVECQGRGCLHLHLLLWLRNAPNTETMRELLTKAEFRERIRNFIRSSIHAHHPDLHDSAAILARPANSEIAFCRPPHPDSPNFLAELDTFERDLMRTKQMHSCSAACLKRDKKGKLYCKRRAPWKVSDDAWVDLSGDWGPKRSYGYQNASNPFISITCRANNDIKLLLNSPQTISLVFYILKYASKNQGRSYNVTALLAKAAAYHRENDPYFGDLKESHRLLLFRCANVLNKQQEIPATLCMSYLMGWGDVYKSHKYINLYWTPFHRVLAETFPSILHSSVLTSSYEPHTSPTVPESTAVDDAGINNPTPRETSDLDSTGENNDSSEHEEEETITLSLDSLGRVKIDSCVLDYMHRGNAMDAWNVAEFFANSYEFSKSSASANHVPYLSSHPQQKSVVRVVRQRNHNNILKMSGRKLPRDNDPDNRSLFIASILMLYKPWRSASDLKRADESWEEAYQLFMLEAPSEAVSSIANILSQNRSADAAEQEREAATLADSSVDVAFSHSNEYASEDESEDLPTNVTVAVTDDMIEDARQRTQTKLLDRYALDAVTIGHINGVFTCQEQALVTTAIRRGTASDSKDLRLWMERMDAQATANMAIQTVEGPVSSNLSTGHAPDVLPLNTDNLHQPTDFSSISTEEALSPAAVNDLLPDQRRAFDIVVDHLSATLTGKSPSQLLMQIHGEGGTGKSKVIQTITKEFENRGVKGILLKMAYTGIAASLIEGKTTHSAACISKNSKMISTSAKRKLARIWDDIQYVIIDEISMIGRSFLFDISRRIHIGKGGAENAAHSFGNVNVILCGDFHQFPPVASRARAALYYKGISGSDIPQDGLGGALYENFTKVVILKQQVRVRDHGWRDLLDHLRRGFMEQKHLTMLDELCITHPKCPPTDFSSSAWLQASLVTPRHSVKEGWNSATLDRHCRATGEPKFVCPTDYNIKGRALSNIERLLVASHTPSRNERKRLPPETISLARGMRVMVTINVHTDLDIANGTRGVIQDIVLDPCEDPPLLDAAEIVLKRPPLFVLVKLEHTRLEALPGLEKGVIPIAPLSTTMRIHDNLSDPTTTSAKTVTRRQLPIVAAYAFTDYRSQGQTIPNVVVDIAPPRDGKLSLFNVYVALSRSSGRDTIRLLRPFDRSVFAQPLCPDLIQEDERLNQLDLATKKWWESKQNDTSNTDDVSMHIVDD